METALENKQELVGAPVRSPRAWLGLEPDDWLVLGWSLAGKALLFLFGASVIHALENRRYQSWTDLLESWNRWDAPAFISVAKDGYEKGRTLVVLPLYPLCIRAFTWITESYLVSAFLVSTIALGVAVVLLRRLIRIDYAPALARRAVWFLLIFPAAYFLQVGYTEPLFLATVFASLLSARRERWWEAGICGALASACRMNGILLLPVLAVEAACQWRVQRKWKWSWLWILFLPAGYGVFLAINYRIAGNPLAFFDVRRDIFRTATAWPWHGIHGVIGDLKRQPNQAETVAVQELVFIFLGLFGAIVSWFKLRPTYAAWITLNWLGFCSLTFIQCAPRYSLPLFPIYLLFAIWARNRFWNGLITVWSLMYFALFASLFVRGWWAF